MLKKFVVKKSKNLCQKGLKICYRSLAHTTKRRQYHARHAGHNQSIDLTHQHQPLHTDKYLEHFRQFHLGAKLVQKFQQKIDSKLSSLTNYNEIKIVFYRIFRHYLCQFTECQ